MSRVRLRDVVIEGYRSIRDPLSLDVDRLVTVLLAANDHGKTNVLDALVHLNDDAEFRPDDINMDRADSPDRFPTISYTFALAESERDQLRVLERRRHQEDVYEALVQKHKEQRPSTTRRAELLANAPRRPRAISSAFRPNSKQPRLARQSGKTLGQV